MQLIAINPKATRKQLLNALLSINQHYTAEPLTKDEIIRIFNANYAKYKKEGLDITKYEKKKYVLFHDNCTIPRNERISIAITERNKILGKSKEDTIGKINDAVESLQDGKNKITQEMVKISTGLSIQTIKKYWIHFKSLVYDYNQSIK